MIGNKFESPECLWHFDQKQDYAKNNDKTGTKEHHWVAEGQPKSCVENDLDFFKHVIISDDSWTKWDNRSQ